jgi:hypothetical protein
MRHASKGVPHFLCTYVDTTHKAQEKIMSPKSVLAFATRNPIL